MPDDEKIKRVTAEVIALGLEMQRLLEREQTLMRELFAYRLRQLNRRPVIFRPVFGPYDHN
jgi:hypothetical protein